MEDWLRPLVGSLRLSRPEGTLLLVRHAPPHRLPVLLRALLPEFPDLLVLGRLEAVAAAPEGALVVLLPSPGELDALNLHRPILARRRLRVILWCDEETGAQLRIRAPDLADWVLRGVDCAPAPPPWEVEGLRALRAAGVTGCLWEGEGHEEALRAAGMGPATYVSAARSYEVLLREIREAPAGPLCFTQVDSGVRLRRLRWALAQARWPEPALIVRDRIERPGGHGSARPFAPDWAAHGWWRLPGSDAWTWRLPTWSKIFIDQTPTAGVRNEQAGPASARRPDVINGLLGFEAAAMELCAALLAAGQSEDELVARLLASADPGAEAARLAMGHGIVSAEDVACGVASPPLLRGLWDHEGVRAIRDAWRAEPESSLAHLGAVVALRTERGSMPPPIDAGTRRAWYLAEPLLRGVHPSKLAEDAPARSWLVRTAQGAWDRRVASAWAGRKLKLPRPPRPRGPWDVTAAEQALKQAEEDLGPEHPRVADWLEQVAEARRVSAEPGLFGRGWSDEMGPRQRVLAIREESQGPEHPDTARAAAALAETLIERGWFWKGSGHEPEELQRRALAIWARTPALGYERAAVLAQQARTLRGRVEESMERLKEAAAELRRSAGDGGRLRVLGLWPPRYLSLDHVVDMITLLSRLRRYLEEGPLAGGIALDSLLLPQDWARPALLDPEVIIYGGDFTATSTDARDGWQTTDPSVVLMARFAPEAFQKSVAGSPQGRTIHLFMEELLTLLPRLQAPLRCVCLPEPWPLDLPFFQKHLAGRAEALLLWRRRGLGKRSFRSELALTLFCEALGLGANLDEALARTGAELGGEPGLQLVRL